MKRRRHLPGGLSVSLPDRVWQLMLLASGATERERTSAALARRAGITPAHLRDVLTTAGEGVIGLEPGNTWALRRTYALALSDRVFVEGELRAVNRRLASTGSAMPTKGDAARAALEEAESALAAFDITSAVRVIRSAGLTARTFLPLMPAKERGYFRGRLARLRVDVFMQAGDGREATAEAARVLREPDGIHPEHLVRLYLDRTAALSFEHLRASEESLSNCDAGMAAIARLPFTGGEARYFLRWAHTMRATSLTIAGRFEEARSTLGRAEELLNPSQPDLTDARSEILLYQARLAAAEDQARLSQDLVEAAAALLPGAARWVRGWYPRYAADATVGSIIRAGVRVGSEERNQAVHFLLDAWRATSGFGYQRRVVLERLAHLDADPEDGESSGDTIWASIRAEVARLHRVEHDVRPSECRACTGERFSRIVLHSLGRR